MNLRRALAGPLAVALATAPSFAHAQTKITSPKEFFGFDIGADYELPNYTKLHQYFAKVAKDAPDRVKLDTIGYTELGKPQIMAIVTSPENMKNLARYKEISRKLALAEGVDSAEAKRLAKEGKTVVWIDGGLHATEVLGAQQLIEDLWQFASMDDEETKRFRDNCIILLVHANPDGQEMVSDWYMKDADKTKRNTNIPDLYNKYAGHDDNRDSFMNALKETTNMSRVAFMEWHPQILYNHHQTGPAGAVMFAPPFRDPANYYFHNGMITAIDRLGADLHSRMIAEGKAGTTMRSGSSYSTWWNGGVRTIAYFHNMVGLLTETIGNPTPEVIPFVAGMQMRTADLPFPITPQVWHFRQSIDYSITANRAILDDAARNKEFWLFNRWQMGRDEIAEGNKDTWIITPRHMAEIDKAMTADGAGGRGGRGGGGGGGRGGAAAPPGTQNKYYLMLHRPELREPRGYILPASQPDFATATKFVQALQKSGIQFMRATAAFTVAGKSYPQGSWVVKTAQAFRPHVLDMFEPQDHPDDFKFPGAAPTPPYDNAGWTLAMQMGVQYDRILDGFDGPFERVKEATVSPVVATVVPKAKAGYYVLPEVNDAMTVSNRLAKAGATAFRVPNGFKDGTTSYPAGTWFIPAGAAADKIVTAAAKDLGVTFAAASSKPAGAQQIKPLRVALADRFGGNMPSGWTRLVMEQFEVPYTLVYPQELDKGNLKAKYDVIVFTDGMISDGGGRGGFGGNQDTLAIPAQYRNRLGRISPENTVPKLKEFMDAGGRIVTIGSSIALGKQIGLPVDNFLVEAGKPLAREKYYIPGSLLEVKMDTSSTIAAGMPARTTIMFDNSPVMKLGPDAAAKGLRPLATFDTDAPLRSGWAWGQSYLKGGVAMAEAKVGQGQLYLFGPEILFRAQPHGTFKLLLNALTQGYDRKGPLQ